MGYWGSHPMAGDAPLDAVDLLKDLLFTPEEQAFEPDPNDPDEPAWGPGWDGEELAKRLNERLPEVVAWIEASASRPGDRFTADDRFVLPFLMAEHGLRTADQALSARIKAMIGDGGARRRRYTDEDFARGKGPRVHAERLHASWDAFMAGSEPDDPGDVGLMATIATHLAGEPSPQQPGEG